MSGNYIPFSGNSPAYGQGPQHLFFSGLGQAAPPAQATPTTPFGQVFQAPGVGMPAQEGALADVFGPTTTPDTSGRTFGSSNAGTIGRGLGMVGSLMGIPGATAIGSLMGNLQDIQNFETDLAAMGRAQSLSTPAALANSLSFGLFGQSPAEQFGQISGFTTPEGRAGVGQANDAIGRGFGLGSRGYTSPADPVALAEAIANADRAATEEAATTAATMAAATEFGAPPGGVMGTPSDPTNPTTDTSNPSTDTNTDTTSTDQGTGVGGTPGDGGVYKAGGLVGESRFAQGGLTELPGGGKVAHGPGGGLDDLIPTSIDGRRAAKLSDGEFVIPADVVSMMGDGSSRAGSQRLYDLVKNVRQDKTGTNKQAGPLEVGAILRRVFK